MPGWRQKSVLLKQASIEQAAQRLKQRGDRTDFSDLMQALLEAWLQTPEAY
jgi:aryl carrier-like protein